MIAGTGPMILPDSMPNVFKIDPKIIQNGIIHIVKVPQYLIVFMAVDSNIVLPKLILRVGDIT